MTKITVTAALVAILLSSPALSDTPDQIRAKLLATPVWAYEWKVPNAPSGKVNTGKAWFAEKDGKLIGYLDDGWKCDSEVTLRADGFDMETCADGDKQFVRSGDGFTATFGTYHNTIRPAP